jgi:hypothetical protein
MFFGQKIHPLNFDFADALTVAGDAVELSGPASNCGFAAPISPGGLFAAALRECS